MTHIGRKRPGVPGRVVEQFFQEGLKEDAPCWICNQPINYKVRGSGYNDGHNLDHYYPVSRYPELVQEYSNFRHAHAGCNTSRGNRTMRASLERNSERWLEND